MTYRTDRAKAVDAARVRIELRARERQNPTLTVFEVSQILRELADEIEAEPFRVNVFATRICPYGCTEKRKHYHRPDTVGPILE